MSTRTLKICLTAALATGALAASAGAEFTVVEHEKFQEGDALDISCNETVTKSYRLPEGATDVRVLEPHAGDALKDGFGDARLATFESVEVDQGSIDVTVVADDYTCSYPSSAWRTNGILVRATYDRTLHPKVFVSEEPGGLDARQEPKQITATADAGWKAMDWKNWGENTAVATGRFYGVRAVSVNGAAVLKTFSYPVEVKLSKIERCGDGYFYSKLRTRWLRKPNPEIAKQAKVPGVAGCLSGG
jgi:hypothetical protein